MIKNSISNSKHSLNIKLFILLLFICIKGAKVFNTYSWEKVKQSKFKDILEESIFNRKGTTVPIELGPLIIMEIFKFMIKILSIN
jgi:hypothetical protein